MRKCPNCKNPLSVGARRCVHCRALVGDSMNDHDLSTHMGLGGYTSEEDRASSTSLGLPGSSALSRSVDGTRRQKISAFDESPHHTMLGLGPVISNVRNPHDSNNDTMGAFAGQRTISGMPGISGFTQNQLSALARTPERPLKAVSMRPTREVQTVGDADLMSMRQNTPSVPIAVPPSEAMRSEPKLDAFESSTAANVPSTSEVVFDSMLQFNAASADSDDDPFAGLPGVEPKPSSLVDEEFVDLTSKLFGDDFAAGTANVDDDEDGWDFDFAPEPMEESPEEPKPVVQQTEAKTVEPSDVVVSGEKSEGAISASGRESKVEQPIKTQEKPTVKADSASVHDASKAANVATHVAAASGNEDATLSNPMSDFVLKCAAWSTLSVYILWFTVAMMKDGTLKNGEGAGLLLSAVVGLAFIANVVYLFCFDKIRRSTLSGMLGVATVLLVVATVYAYGIVRFNIPLIVIPMILQGVGVVMMARRS